MNGVPPELVGEITKFLTVPELFLLKHVRSFREVFISDDTIYNYCVQRLHDDMTKDDAMSLYVNSMIENEEVIRFVYYNLTKREFHKHDDCEFCDAIEASLEKHKKDQAFRLVPKPVSFYLYVAFSLHH